MAAEKTRLNDVLMSEDEAAAKVFPKVLAWRFWLGFVAGILVMAAFDLSDFHIRACIGECTDTADIRVNAALNHSEPGKTPPEPKP